MDLLIMRFILVFITLFVGQVGYSQKWTPSKEVDVDSALWNVGFSPQAYYYKYQGKKNDFKLLKADTAYSNLPEGALIKSIALTPDVNKSFILPLHKLSFIFSGYQTSIIKFKVYRNGLWGEIKTLTFQRRGGSDSNNWELVNVPELENIVYAIKVIKPEYFWDFKSLNGDSGIEAIDNINRDFVGLDKNTLNIARLGSYLKSKPKELEPYCDFY